MKHALIPVFCLLFSIAAISRESASSLPILSSQWNDLGEEVYGPIYEIVLHNGDVYIGGGFLDAGGNPDADYLARWDGCQWHAVGAGLNGDVNALAFVGDDLYVGGSFLQPYNFICRWDGAQWESLGAGVSNVVRSIVIDGNFVYAGGGTWNAGFVSEWNGNSWSALDNNLNAQVNHMEVTPLGFYVAGRFTNAGGNPNADGVVKWEDNAWQNLGTGIDAGMYSLGPRDLLFYEGDLYVGGVYGNAGGNPLANYISKWDGSNWIALSNGPGGFLGLYDLAVLNGYLYTSVGGGWASNDGIYRWSFATETWEIFQIMELGPDDPIITLVTDESNLYVGSFSGMTIENEFFSSFVRWGEPQSYIVNTTADSGPGSLRQMISCAGNNGVISFSLPPSSQITLTSGEIAINKNLTIAGSGMNNLKISGNNASRIFQVFPGITLNIQEISLVNSYSPINGGAIFDEGSLVLKNILFQNNFQAATPKSFTISPGTLTTIVGNVNLKL